MNEKKADEIAAQLDAEISALGFWAVINAIGAAICRRHLSRRRYSVRATAIALRIDRHTVNRFLRG